VAARNVRKSRLARWHHASRMCRSDR